MLKSVNSSYSPSLVLPPDVKIALKPGSNVIYFSDLFPGNSGEDSSLPVLILTYRGDRRIILKTFKQFPVSLKEKNKKGVKCYMNDSLVVIEDMSTVSLMPLVKDNNSSLLLFDCPEMKSYSFEEEDYHDDFLDNLIEYFDMEKKKLAKEKEDLKAYLKYIDDDKPEKILINKKRDRSPSKPRETEPVKVIPLKKKCSICLEQMVSSCYINTCQHEFCLECINQWAKLSSQCPLCKVSFSKIISDSPSKQRSVLQTVKQQKFTPDEEPIEEWYYRCDEACLICHKADESYLLLVCDKCNTHIAHTYCVGLDFIPEGDWYCPICSSKQIDEDFALKRRKTDKKKLRHSKVGSH